MNEFHLWFTLMVFSIHHKTILLQQMHRAVHIIIMHLNIIHVLARHREPNVCSWIFTHHGRKALFKKTYTLIYYTLKMHLHALSLSFCLCLSLSLSLPCVLSCGRQHWAPSHATSICVLVKRFPCFPPCCSRWGQQQWKRWLMTPDIAGHVSSSLVKGG